MSSQKRNARGSEAMTCRALTDLCVSIEIRNVDAGSKTGEEIPSPFR